MLLPGAARLSATAGVSGSQASQPRSLQPSSNAEIAVPFSQNAVSPFSNCSVTFSQIAVSLPQLHHPLARLAVMTSKPSQ